jgi:hypothetical protein
MAAVLKTARGRELPRGFKSHTLRSSPAQMHADLCRRIARSVRSCCRRVQLYAVRSGAVRVAVTNTCPSASHAATSEPCYRSGDCTWRHRDQQAPLLPRRSQSGEPGAGFLKPTACYPPGRFCKAADSLNTRAVRRTDSRRRSGDIRAWARYHGIAISERGRIPATVLEQYTPPSGRANPDRPAITPRKARAALSSADRRVCTLPGQGQRGGCRHAECLLMR